MVQLSADVYRLIFQHVSDTWTLLKAAVSCKAIHEPAMAQLYGDIGIEPWTGKSGVSS